MMEGQESLLLDFTIGGVLCRFLCEHLVVGHLYLSLLCSVLLPIE